MKRFLEARGLDPKRTLNIKPVRRHYKCPEGTALLYLIHKRYQIRVLLDSGSNIFQLNPRTAQKIPVFYEAQEIPLAITAFNGEMAAGGKYYTYRIKLEIGNNG